MYTNFGYNNMQIGAMSDHIESIKKGFLVLLPVLDEKGRAIIYGEPTLAEGEVDKVCMCFCMWVLLHIYNSLFRRLINSCLNINRLF